MSECLCGCGQTTPRQYRPGHNRRKRQPRPAEQCACGCGQTLLRSAHRHQPFARGHHMRINPTTPKKPRVSGWCACGCGNPLQPVQPRLRKQPFLRGHYMRLTPHNKGKTRFQPGDTRGWHGYIQIFSPGHPLASHRPWVFEHRKVVFDSGFQLESKDHVHHINKNKADNRLENLKVMNVSIHQQWHGHERGGWQPAISRLRTLVAWAHAILNEHGHRFPE